MKKFLIGASIRLAIFAVGAMTALFCHALGYTVGVIAAVVVALGVVAEVLGELLGGFSL